MFTHLESEIYFRTSRSSGKGGQNVNKVSTKVELNFDVTNSKLLTEEQKQQILSRLHNYVNKDEILKVVCQESRSQLTNKGIAFSKFLYLLDSCFLKKRKRIRTKISASFKEKRLQIKKKRSEIKRGRSSKWD